MLVIKQFGPVTYAMGTLQEILAGTGIAAKVRALPNDVAGCTLEMGSDGKWYGDLGTMPKATANALYASGALANLAAGVTYCNTSGTQYTYSAGAGWVGSITPKTGNKIACFGNSIGLYAYMPTQNAATIYWSPASAIALDAVIGVRHFLMDDSGLHRIFTCVTAGITGSSEPLWSSCAIGSTITDGTAVYSCSLDTSSYYSYGYFAMANAIAGQVFDEVFLAAWGGGQSPTVLAAREKMNAICDPDWVYYGPVFENDCWPGAAPVLSVIESNWIAFESMVADDIARGRQVIVQTLFPSANTDSTTAFTNYNYGNGTKAHQWLNNKIRQLAASSGRIHLFEAGAVYTSADHDTPIYPDNSQTYTSRSGTGSSLKLTDAIHPGIVARQMVAYFLADFFATLGLNKYPLIAEAKDANRCSPNPAHSGTSGTLGPNGSGQVADRWDVHGYGGVSTVSSKIARGFRYWTQCVYTATAGENLSFSGFMTLEDAKLSVGDVVQMYQEVEIDGNPVGVENIYGWLRFDGSIPNIDARSMLFGGELEQDHGQAINKTTRFILKTPKTKIPANTTGFTMDLQVTHRGTALSTVRFGDIFLQKIGTLDLA